MRALVWIVPILLAFPHVKCLETPKESARRKDADETSLVDGLPDLYEASILDLQGGLEKGLFTSVDLVKAYTARIAEVNEQGPALRAVIEVSLSALDLAATLDEERKANGTRGPLHGIPILLKDNIATIAQEGLNTTAGSYSLEKSVVPGDAGVVERLRKAGAVILGKANLSEFAYFREWTFPSGWSGRGGQCLNAYSNNTDPCGSSSGSGVAASIGLSAVTLGSETDGSITCPSDHNNIVGIKPTVGLTSRAGVIPISEHQDTVGPMTRTVTDAALVLAAIAGQDPKDNYTLAQPPNVPDYSKALLADALKGKRLGVPRINSTATNPNDTVINEAFEKAIQTLRDLGATVIDPVDLPSAKQIVDVGDAELFVLETDFKIQLNAYYESLVKNPSGVHSLADLIEFNDAHPEIENPVGLKGQSILIESQATAGRNSTFVETLASNRDIGGTQGIDAALKANKLDALLAPGAAGWLTTPAALAGYPIVTVPLGFYPDDTTPVPGAGGIFWPAPGVPFGLSFVGTAWSEFDLIGFAYAYEQKTKTRLQKRARTEAIPKTQLVDIIES